MRVLQAILTRLEALEQAVAKAERVEELFQRTVWPLRGKVAGLSLSGQVGPNRP